jgi:hypothetical protein
VITDYFLTFHFAGSTEAILKYEFSPILLFAVKHDIVIPYLMGMILFYYAAGSLDVIWKTTSMDTSGTSINVDILNESGEYVSVPYF